MVSQQVPQSPTRDEDARREHWGRWAAILLLFVAGAVYMLTLDNGLAPEELHGGDLITHQYAQVQARPGNAPGYPIFTMLGWLWFHGVRSLVTLLGNALPNPIPILSLYSTIWALIAVWLLYQIVRFVTSTRYRSSSRRNGVGNIILATLLALFLAVTYFFWYYATTTEQYSSAVAQTLAILYLYLLWSEAVETGHLARADRLLIALAFLCGLSLAHMLTVAFIVPPLVGVILWQQSSLLRRWRMIIACVVAAALPLTAYLFIYLRGAAHPEWWGRYEYASAAEWFWSFVRTSQGFRELRWGTSEGRAFWGGDFPELMWQEVSLPLLVIGVVGIAFLRRRTATLLYGTLTIYLLFCWAYRYGNWFQVILPVYPLLLVGVAAAVDRLLRWRPVVDRRWVGALLYALLVVAILWRVDASLPAANSRNRPGDTALNRPAVLLASAPDGAALFAAVDDRLGLDYLLTIWGIPKDATLVDSNNADAASRVHPLLSTWEAAQTLLDEIDPDAWHVAARNGDWVEVGLLGSEHFRAGEPPASGEVAALAPEISVEIVQAFPAPDGSPVFHAPPAVDLLLRWPGPLRRLPVNLAISVRPTIRGELIRLPDGSVSQYDAHQPLHGLVVHANDMETPLDAMRLPLNEPLPTGADALRILLYRTDTGEVINEVDVPLPK